MNVRAVGGEEACQGIGVGIRNDGARGVGFGVGSEGTGVVGERRHDL